MASYNFTSSLIFVVYKSNLNCGEPCKLGASSMYFACVSSIYPLTAMPSLTLTLNTNIHIQYTFKPSLQLEFFAETQQTSRSISTTITLF